MSYIGNTPGVSSQRVVTEEVISGSPKSAFYPIGGYALGYVDVLVNGLEVDSSDFTAADGVVVTLGTAAAVGDTVKIKCYLPRGLSDGYLKAEADAKFALPSQITPTNVSDKGNTSTGFFSLPHGTTAQRPSGNDAGDIRYNSDLGRLEMHNGTAWGNSVEGYTPVNKAGDTMTGALEVSSGGIRNSSQTIFTSNSTLTSSCFGGLVECGGSTAYTITLPNPTACNGALFDVWLNTGSNITFTAPSGNFYGPSGNSSTSIVLSQAGGIWYRFASDGYNWAVSGTPQINSSGNLVLASGKGIDFSANSNASGAVAEVFDDYEVGSWTPIITRNGNTTDLATSYAYRDARYTKTGNVVHYTVDLSASGVSTTNGTFLSVSGLPFTSKSGSIYVVANMRDSGLLPVIGSGLIYKPWVDAGYTYIYIQTDSLTTAGYAGTPQAWNASGRLTLQGWYYAA